MENLGDLLGSLGWVTKFQEKIKIEVVDLRKFDYHDW